MNYCNYEKLAGTFLLAVAEKCTIVTKGLNNTEFSNVLKCLLKKIVIQRGIIVNENIPFLQILQQF